MDQQNIKNISVGNKSLNVKEHFIKAFTTIYRYIPGLLIPPVLKFFGRNHYPEGQRFLEKAALSLQHVLRMSNRRYRKGLIENLLVNECIRGQAMRKTITRSLGFEIPVLLVISPTMRCPLRCFGCYSAQYDRKKDLDYDVFDKLISDAKSLGIFYFVISGGEPFTYPRIHELFRKHSDAFFMVYTSGITMAGGDLGDLPELGNVLPCISIEGFEKETDQRRGEGHFKKVLSTFGHLRKYGVPFGFSVTATRNNSELITRNEFVKFYMDQGASLGWYFQYMPIGRNPDFDLVPTPQQRADRLFRILEFRKKYRILIADFWNDGPLVGGCLAGARRYLHVNSDGDIEPCVFCQISTDNLYSTDLLSALKNSPLFKAIRKHQPYDKNLLKPCMIIDNPHVLKEVIEEVQPKETCSGGAKRLVTDLYGTLEQYAAEYGRLADKNWEKLFARNYEDAIKKDSEASDYFREKSR